MEQDGGGVNVYMYATLGVLAAAAALYGVTRQSKSNDNFFNVV